MISVVIPTHRRADLLQRLLESIAAQTDRDFEVIVVDDASPNTDDYRALVERMRGRLPSLRYERLARNSGAPVARNAGIALARGDWVALVDDDDEWLPCKLELQRAVSHDAPSRVGLIYGWTRIVDALGHTESESRPLIEGDARSAIFHTNFIMSPSVMVRRAAFEHVGTFDEALPSCQDWDMWARVLAGGYECRVVKEIIAVYHRHGGASVGLSARAMEGYERFLRKHWRHVLLKTSPVNWARKTLLYMRASRARETRG